MRGREVDGVTPSRRGGNRRPRGETRGTRGDERRSKTRSTPQDARSDAARRLKSARGSTRWARWATPRPSRPVRRGAGGKPADATYPRIAQPTMMDGTGATGAQWMGKSSDSSVVDHHSAAVIGEYARHRGLVRIGKQSKTKGDFEREWEFLIRKELSQSSFSSSEILNRDESKHRQDSVGRYPSPPQGRGHCCHRADTVTTLAKPRRISS